MDEKQFDTVAISLSRRSASRTLLGGLVGIGGALVALARDGDAKKKKKKRKKGGGQCRKHIESCTSSSQCCDQANDVCDEGNNIFGGKYCCRTQGKQCTGNLDCCEAFGCDFGGTCEPK